jgi:hypothetical protein
MKSSHPGAPKPERALPHYVADVPVFATATPVPGRRWRQIILRALLALMLAAVSMALVYMGGLYLFRFLRERGVSDPAADFARLTGLDWPSTAKVIVAEDNHRDLSTGGVMVGPGLGDGTLVIVFDTKPTVVAAWLAGPPPLDSGPWRRGPVPLEILHRFTTSGETAKLAPGSAIPGADVLARSSTIWFVARDSGPSPRAPSTLTAGNLGVDQEPRCVAPPWDNGSLMAIDPLTGRVWISAWNY